MAVGASKTSPFHLFCWMEPPLNMLRTQTRCHWVGKHAKIRRQMVFMEGKVRSEKELLFHPRRGVGGGSRCWEDAIDP
jgi:hypothetical protein